MTKKKTTATAKKAATAKKPAVSEAAAKAAFDRIQAGKTSVKHESRLLGFKHNGSLRKAIIALVGRPKYFAVIANPSARLRKKKNGATT